MNDPSQGREPARVGKRVTAFGSEVNNDHDEG